MVKQPEQSFLPGLAVRQILHHRVEPLGLQLGSLRPGFVFCGIEQRLVGFVLHHQVWDLHLSTDEGQRIASLDFINQNPVAMGCVFKSIGQQTSQPLFAENPVQISH